MSTGEVVQTQRLRRMGTQGEARLRIIWVYLNLSSFYRYKTVSSSGSGPRLRSSRVTGWSA